MKKITYKYCLNEVSLKAILVLIFIAACIIESIVVFILDIYNNSLNRYWYIYIPLLFVLVPILMPKTLYRIVPILNKRIYIIEDTLINIERLKYFSRFHLRTYNWNTLYFLNNGKYKAESLFRKTNIYDIPENYSPDFIACDASKPDDKFYLLMLRDEKKGDKILKAFHTRYFFVSDEDFIFVDGKYICSESCKHIKITFKFLLDLFKKY